MFKANIRYSGCIHLLRGNPRINKMADKIFEEYQIEAYSGELQFRRYPLRMVFNVTYYQMPFNS